MVEELREECKGRVSLVCGEMQVAKSSVVEKGYDSS